MFKKYLKIHSLFLLTGVVIIPLFFLLIDNLSINILYNGSYTAIGHHYVWMIFCLVLLLPAFIYFLLTRSNKTVSRKSGLLHYFIIVIALFIIMVIKLYYAYNINKSFVVEQSLNEQLNNLDTLDSLDKIIIIPLCLIIIAQFVFLFNIIRAFRKKRLN